MKTLAIKLPLTIFILLSFSCVNKKSPELIIGTWESIDNNNGSGYNVLSFFKDGTQTSRVYNEIENYDKDSTPNTLIRNTYKFINDFKVLVIVAQDGEHLVDLKKLDKDSLVFYSDNSLFKYSRSKK